MMVVNDQTKRKERDLIEAWLLANEGRASDSQLETLSRQLEQDPAARQLILSIAHHQGWLVWQGGPTMNVGASQCGNEGSADTCLACTDLAPMAWHARLVGWSGNLRSTRLFSLAGMIMVACLCAALLGLQQARRNPATFVTDDDLLDARIVGGTPCVWDSSGIQYLDPNHRLRQGDSLQLLEGIAELSLENQSTMAKVVMEGPAAVLLAREATPSLRYGKITVATEAPSITRFPVETPFGRVMLEAGTEVGISAFGGSAQVHVFTGVATVKSPWLVSQADNTDSRIVSAGEALFFDGVGDVALRVAEGKASRDRFTPQVSMQSDFLLVGPEYVQSIRNAEPVAYWRFERDASNVAASDVLMNTMGDRFNGRLRGKVRWVGPDGNQAIEFGVTPEPGSMVVDESWDDVLDGDCTLEAWIKPSHYHCGSILGFIGEFDWKDRRNKHGLLLEVGGTSQPSTIHQPERIRFLHRPKLGVMGGVSCFSDRSYQPRRWQHVVAVREGDSLQLYLDGKLVANGTDPNRLTTGLQLVLGQLYTETVERFFIGHVDEVAIYDRALSAEEIRQHHRLLRPGRESDQKKSTSDRRLTERASTIENGTLVAHF
jgi:hypothetical protein